ncbi:hypothetical protein SMC92_001904 [Cronobacter dublinensis]|nr:hypothetical protein [Cronobacter dublinensis]
MNVYEFVCSNFGQDEGTRLKHIGTGGNNNFKGSEYEATLAAIKICQAASEHRNDNLDEILISAQEESFVDDLCVINKLTRVKTNFQAKNSDGSAASWTDEMQSRFSMQKKIDEELHGYSDNQQILVVSSVDKHNQNTTKIPAESRGFFFSEYIPYEYNRFDLFREYPDLRTALHRISEKNTHSDLDYVYSLVISAWANSRKKSSQTIGDLIGAAKALGRPNWIVVGDSDRSIPAWLNNACATFPGFDIHVESGRFIVVLDSGFSIDVGKDPIKPHDIEAIQTADELVVSLMSLINDELSEQQDFEQAS